MKRAVVLSAIVALGLGTAGIFAQGNPLPPPRPIEKIGDNLYKIFGGGGNTTVYVGEEGVVLVDTKMPGNGETIMSEIRKITDKPVIMVINTHAHPDHLGSNAYFKEHRPTVEVVMHENAAAAATKPAFGDPAVVDRTFADKLSVGKGKDQIDLYYFGAAHTNGDSFVVFPSERAMAAGDVMAWKMAPLIDSGSGGSILALPDTLDRAIAGIKNVDKVIEGHGDVNTWEGFKLYNKFMRALIVEAKKAQDAGLTPGHAVAELEKNPEFKPFLGTKVLEGLEYGGTPKSRALINTNVAFGEYKGEPVAVFAPAPPSLEEQQAAKAAGQ